MSAWMPVKAGRYSRIQNSSQPSEKVSSDKSGYLVVLETALDTYVWATESELMTSKIKLLTGSGIERGLAWTSMARFYGSSMNQSKDSRTLG